MRHNGAISNTFLKYFLFFFIFFDRIRMDMPAKPKYNLPFIDFGDETIGQRIANIRTNKNISQQELADKIGIKRVLVSDYERGKLRLFDEMVARFAIALEVTTDELLGLKAHPPAKKK